MFVELVREVGGGGGGVPVQRGGADAHPSALDQQRYHVLC